MAKVRRSNLSRKRKIRFNKSLRKSKKSLKRSKKSLRRSKKSLKRKRMKGGGKAEKITEQILDFLKKQNYTSNNFDIKKLIQNINEEPGFLHLKKKNNLVNP